MQTRTAIIRLLLLVALGATLAVSPAAADSNGYSMEWHTVDGGGEIVAGGIHDLTGTIGQADAGLLSVGDYTLAGGFWGDQALQFWRFLPLQQR